MSSILDQHLPSNLYDTDEVLSRSYLANTRFVGAIAGFLFFWISWFAAPIAAAIFGVLAVYSLRLTHRWNRREDFARDKAAQAAQARSFIDGKERYIEHLSNLVTESAAKALYFEAWVRVTPEAKRTHEEAIRAEAERLRAEHEAHWGAAVAAINEQLKSEGWAM